MHTRMCCALIGTPVYSLPTSSHLSDRLHLHRSSARSSSSNLPLPPVPTPPPHVPSAAGCAPSRRASPSRTSPSCRRSNSGRRCRGLAASRSSSRLASSSTSPSGRSSPTTWRYATPPPPFLCCPWVMADPVTHGFGWTDAPARNPLAQPRDICQYCTVDTACRRRGACSCGH